MYKSVLLILLIIIGLTTAKVSAAVKSVRLVVEAGAVTRINTPVSVTLPTIAGLTISEIKLEELVGTKRIAVPLQVEPGAEPRIWWILSGTTKANTKRIFELTKGTATRASKSVQVQKDDKILKVLLGDKNVLQYNHALVQPPAGKDPKYVRGGFIHPLWSPGGQVLTRIHAPDHYHHFGLWNPWTKSNFEGRHVDFWNIKDGTGTVQFVNFASAVSGEVFGGFRAVQNHVDLSAPGGGKVALNEEWDVRVYNLEAAGKGAYLIDFTSKLNCASNSPITLEEYRYGGFGYRGKEEWNDKNAWALTSEGKTRENIDGSTARWTNVWGVTEKGNSGIVFMGHPYNFNFPEPVRMWPLGSNKGVGNVFFNFAPTKNKDWKLVPGHDYVLKYRMLVYDGELKKEIAEQAWQDFGNPPVVKVELK